MPDWTVQIIMGALGVAVIAGFVRAQVGALAKGQERIGDRLDKISGSVSDLVTAAAVNSAQHEAISTRVSTVEHAIGRHEEQIRILRTKTHMLSNKMMEVDPEWKPYQKSED